MKYAVAAAALVAAVSAQSCLDTVPYTFQLIPVNVSESTHSGKRDLGKVSNYPSSSHACILIILKRVAQCSQTPVVTLQGGVLHDQDNRQGEVVVNHQFQFDKPLQAALFQTGFCINQNTTLSIGGSAIFYSCISGTFSNLYNADIGSVCSQVYLDAVECIGGVSSNSATLSASTSTQSASSMSSTSVATTSASTPATTPASTPASTPMTTPVTSAIMSSMASMPYPVGNSTTAAGTASAAPKGSGSTSTATTAGTSKTSAAVYQPSSGANVLAMGGQLLAGIAAIGAYALF